MKVMCIKQFTGRCVKGMGATLFTRFPSVGSIYTVCNTTNFKGDIFYHLAELNKNDGFSQRNFSPLSDIDETELVNEYQLVNPSK